MRETMYNAYERMLLQYKVPERPLCDSVEVLMPGDALLLERLHCDSGELLVHGYEVPKLRAIPWMRSSPATRS